MTVIGKWSYRPMPPTDRLLEARRTERRTDAVERYLPAVQLPRISVNQGFIP